MMMMSIAVFALSSAALGGCVCRLDALHWREHRPVAIIMHIALALGCAWCLTKSVAGTAGLDELALALLAAGWIAASYGEWSAGVPAWAHSFSGRWRSPAARDATAPVRIPAEAPASQSQRAPGEL